MTGATAALGRVWTRPMVGACGRDWRRAPVAGRHPYIAAAYQQELRNIVAVAIEGDVSRSCGTGLSPCQACIVVPPWRPSTTPN